MPRSTLALFIGMLILVSAGVVRTHAQEPTKVHPSKIPPQQTGNVKFCASCHKTAEGKFTHTAVRAMGCVGCHDIKTQGETTTIGLVASGKALCLICHGDKDGAQAKGRIHAPVAEGECVTCHSPHASGNKFQLLQPTSGGTDENLCLKCHHVGEGTPQKGSRHPALDLGCENCHLTHKSGAPGTPEYFHLAQAAPSLCLTCHDAADKTLLGAHQGQPFAAADCLACHNPHASPNPKLTHAYAHVPFAERQCDACHEAPKNGKIQVTEEGKRALCFLCHDGVQSQLASARHKHSVFEVTDTCTTCHSPHATPNPKQLIAPVVALCEGCHTERADEQTKMKYLHQPVFQAGCTVCHLPHAAENSSNLRARVEELCLSCHARDAGSEAGPDAATLVLFSGAVRLPGNYLETVKRLPLLRGAVSGHPLGTHPVSGKPDPSNPQRNLSCVSCHNPHASNGSAKFLVSGTRSSSPLCVRCHK